MLRAYHNQNVDEWTEDNFPTIVNSLLEIYHGTVHTSTKYTPNYLWENRNDLALMDIVREN
jgi:hypothetical protein